MAVAAQALTGTALSMSDAQALCAPYPGTNIIVGTDGNDVIDGTNQADCIVAGKGDDTINSGNGNDVIFAGDGRDTINGGNGADIIHAGPGNDFVRGGNDNDTLYGEDGDDEVYGENGDDKLYLGAGNDRGYGGNGNDELHGDDGADILLGENGNDLLLGEGCHDRIVRGNGTDSVNGGAGVDSCTGTACELAESANPLCTRDADCGAGKRCVVPSGVCVPLSAELCAGETPPPPPDAGTSCTPSSSTDTTCNGVDDNCNGAIDEDYIRQPINCGVGACATTAWTGCVGGSVVQSCTPGTPAPNDVTCNGVDDNCNGSVDEGFVGSSTICGVGACAAQGQTRCMAGHVVDSCTPGMPAASDATCDGRDDNCNGSVDEDYVPQSVSCGVGACNATGTTVCSGGHVVSSCSAGNAASDDSVCNGIDDDCNGAVDEDFVGQTTQCGVGACKRQGNTTCVSGHVVDSCTRGTPSPSDTTCDGRDDDCNGAVDDGYVSATTHCGVGSCAATGATSCVSGVVVDSCAPATAATSDATCDGRDDDCDGRSDEDYTPTPVSCGVGACRASGTTVCNAGVLADSCTPGSGAARDVVCNGIDDDCNGSVDDDYAPQTTSCGVGACARTGTTQCTAGTETDSCVPGTPASSDASCNGVDDDCDGRIDDDYASAETACGSGACARTGATQCVNGTVTDSCVPGQPAATDDTCDGVDDNCNGRTDEGYVAVTVSCGAGACAATGTLSCVQGHVVSSCTPGTAASSDGVCNGIDDDCNGLVDEDYASGATTCGIGACAAVGHTRCENGAVIDSCAPAGGAASDTSCNGIDEDCDGSADEDYVPQRTSCGVGACAATGSTACVHGIVVDSCTVVAAATSDATCDGVDDDCDGHIDEDFAASATHCGIGPCAAQGATQCVLGRVVDSCVPGAGASDDATCDGIDDDCGGSADEDYVPEPTTCGTGACAATGQTECVSGQVVDKCVAGAPRGDDATCDGIDDDCDGNVDEDCAGGSSGSGGSGGMSGGGSGGMSGGGSGGMSGGGSGGMSGGGAGGSDGGTSSGPASIGAMCSADTDCVGLEAAADTVLCLAWLPGGYCTRTCDPSREACPMGSHCLGGLCLLNCGDGNTCADSRNICTDADGFGEAFCRGSCAQCQPGEGCEVPIQRCYACSEDDTGCDGIDDDCDGKVDEDFVATATTCGQGTCSGTGNDTCTDGIETDSCSVPSGCEASCENQTDDDQDGQIDCDDSDCNHAYNCLIGAACARDSDCQPIGPQPWDLPLFCDVKFAGGYCTQKCNDSVQPRVLCPVGTYCAAEHFQECVRPCDENASCKDPRDVCADLPAVGAKQPFCRPSAPCVQAACPPRSFCDANNQVCVSDCASADTTCDGMDDDCDGSVDEDMRPVPTTCGSGQCTRSGEFRCVNGEFINTCIVPDDCRDCAANDASCDGLDDDCDGHVDEDFQPYATVCGLGSCGVVGTVECVNGATVASCGNAVNSTDTTCDNVDDDCNGVVDDGFLTTFFSCGVGGCSALGTRQCTGGVVVESCTPGEPQPDANCNNLDDDCDGLIDEDYAPMPTTCGRGVCAGTGQTTCIDGVERDSCYGSGPTLPSDTTCNGLDEDCDGRVDDDVPTCVGTVRQTCIAGVLSTEQCDDADQCNGQETCAAGACVQGVAPVVDDGNPCTVDSCGPESGVLHDPMASGASCSDGNVCNGAELCGVQSAQCAPVPSNVVSWWPADGTARDVRRGRDGTPASNLGFAAGRVGQAFDFSRNGALVDLSPHASALNLSGVGTLELWVATATDTCQTLFQIWGADSSQQSLQIGDGCAGDVFNELVTWSHFSGSERTVLSYASASRGILIGTGFHHLALTFDGSFMRLYIDGVARPVAANPGTGVFGGLPLASSLLLGAQRVDAAPLGKFFHGQMDEVTVYDRALSSVEVQRIYSAGSNGKCRPTCNPGTPIVISDGNDCTTDTCDPVLGVHHARMEEGAPCSDGNFCTGGDHCNASGQCQGATTIDPDDSDPCTVDSCGPLGVEHVGLPESVICSTVDRCNDHVDNDADGSADCADPDCAGKPPCLPENCANSIDDDGDGALDCADPDCLAAANDCVKFAADPRSIAPALPNRPVPFIERVRFLYDGPDAIQTGVLTGAIEPDNAGVVKGRVLGRGGQPLPVAAEIRVVGHPEFGVTRTRADGYYDMVVAGGGTLDLDVRSPGYIPVRRQFTLSWQEHQRLDDLVLVPLDPHVTKLNLASAPDMAAARGSAVTDDDGTRRATLLFPQGTVATAKRANGTSVELQTISVRATEFTVGADGPAAMPAPLPVNTAYTYAVELSIDEAESIGATGVEFNRPLPFYVENFVGFPVGAAVPSGYYDRETSRWIPSDNGHVLRILGITQEGAEIDWNGDGQAETGGFLSDRGITVSERHRLGELYAPGSTLWRVPISHFSPLDLNWQVNFLLNLVDQFFDARPPPVPSPDRGQADENDPRDPAEPDCKKKGNSTVGCINRQLSESIPIAGTGYSLNYSSADERSSTSFEVDVMPLELKPNLLDVRVEVSVGGRHYQETFAPGPPTRYRFEWDGLDDMGRRLLGTHLARIRACAHYTGSYLPLTEAVSLARMFGVDLSEEWLRGVLPAVLSRPAVHGEACSTGSRLLSVPRPKEVAGWTLDAVHSYDPVAGELRFGSGDRLSIAPGVIETLPTPPNEQVFQTRSTRSFGLAPDGSIIYARSRWNAGPFGILEHTPIELVARRLNGEVVTTAIDDPSIAPLMAAPDVYQVRSAADGDSIVGHDGIAYLWLRRNCCGFFHGPLVSSSYECSQSQCEAFGPKPGIYRVPFTLNAAGLKAGRPMRVYEAPPYLDGLDYQAHLFDVDKNGVLYVPERRQAADGTVSEVLRRVMPDGTTTDFGDPLRAAARYTAINADDDGTVYVAEGNSPDVARLGRIASDGTYTLLATHDALCIDQPTHETGWVQSECEVRALTFEPAQHHLLALVAMDVQADNYGGRHAASSMVLEFPGKAGPPVRLAGDPHSEWWRVDEGSHRYVDSRRLPARSFPYSIDVEHASGNLGMLPDRTLVFRVEDQAVLVRNSLPAWIMHAANTSIPSHTGSELYEFEPSGTHIRTRSGLTGEVLRSFTYTESGDLAAIDEGNGNTVTIERDGSGNPVAIRAPFGQRTLLGVDPIGRLTSVTAPDGGTQQMTYQGGTLLLTSEKDARGNTHNFEYDEHGRLLRDEGPSGVIELSGTYRAGGVSVVETSPEHRVTHYDTETVAGGSTTTVTQPSGATNQSISEGLGTTSTVLADGTVMTTRPSIDPRWGFPMDTAGEQTETLPSGLRRVTTHSAQYSGGDEHDPFSRSTMTFATNRNGRTSTTSFDTSTRVLTQTSAGGRISRVALDERARVVQTTAPSGATTEVDYDSRGRLHTLITSDGTSQRVLNFAYAADSGYSASIAGPRPADLTTFTRDAFGRTLSANASGSEVRMSYDPAGNLLKLVPADRPAHAFDYNPMGEVSAYRAPNPTDATQSLLQTIEYNGERRPTQVAREDGTSIHYEYDVTTGELMRIVEPASQIDFAYAPSSSQLASLTKVDADASTHTLAMTYDGGLLKSVSAGGSTGASAGTVSFVYNQDFALSDLLINGQSTGGFAYDADLLMTQAGPLTLTRSAATGALTHTAAGLVTTDASVNGFGELAEHSASSAGNVIYQETALARDEAGRILRRREIVLGVTHDYLYTYDGMGRLSQVSVDGSDTPARSYEYDANGNRLRLREGAATREANYDNQDRLTAYGAFSYTYGLSGDLQERTNGQQSTHYRYDAEGALEAVELPDGRTIEYEIDPLHRRVGKRVNGTKQSGFLYADVLQPIAELNASGQVAKTFVYATRTHVPDLMVASGVVYRLVTDHLGSVRFVINTTDGTVAQQLEYDEFGQVLSDSNPDFQPFGFAGGLYDADTGLVRFGARDYDAVTGRWTAKDPILFRGNDANLYQYVQGDPINDVDPNGLLAVFADYVGRATVFPISVQGDFGAVIGTEGADIVGKFYAHAGAGLGIGAAVGRGFEFGAYSGDASDLLSATAVNLDTPLGGVSVLVGHHGIGFSVGGPSLGLALSIYNLPDLLARDGFQTIFKNVCR